MSKTLTEVKTVHRWLIWAIMGGFFVWMWFRPIFWNMTELRSSFWEAFLDIFVYPSTPEYMLGAGIDQLGTFWIFGSLPEILSNHGVLSNVFYPIGWDIGWNTGFAWLDGVFTLPLQWMVGVPTFYNLHVAITLWLSFIGICGLVYRILSPYPIIGLCTAPLFAALSLWTPFTFEEIGMGRPTQVYWVFSALFLCILLPNMQSLQSNQTEYKRFTWIGLLLTASCFVYWFGAVSVGFCGGIAAFCHLFQSKSPKEYLRNHLLAGGVALGSACLLAHRMIFSLWEGTLHFEQLNSLPIRTWSFLELPLYSIHRIHNWPEALQIWNTHPATSTTLFIGLLGALIPFGWKDRWGWILGWLLSLGIPLTGAFAIGDVLLPTGQGILTWLFPLLRRCEDPERMVVATTLFSLIVGMQGLRALFEYIEHKYPTARINWSLLGLLPLLLLLNPPTPDDLKVSSFVIDEVRLEIAQKFPGAMIDAPFSRSENTYIQQLFHQQPLLGGPGLNRVQPLAHRNYCQQNAFLRGLEDLDHHGTTAETFEPSDIQTLLEDGFSVIVFDPQSRRFSARVLEDFLNIQPDFRDERTGIRAYSLQRLKID